MPKLEHWIIASKMVEVLDHDTIRAIMDAGGLIGGGWCEIHQHICVNHNNKEQIEQLLKAKGFIVSGASEHRVAHPEVCKLHGAVAE
ncbi:MAG TPA: hypothetical protein ENN80_12090 [Candidatus Hydrogenedentes bacterium]|nr:hypothetical protein [Candidatus Hydrogenedentota bacterium]